MSHFKDDLLTPRDNERIAESWTDISSLLLSGLWYWHNLIVKPKGLEGKSGPWWVGYKQRKWFCSFTIFLILRPDAPQTPSPTQCPYISYFRASYSTFGLILKLQLFVSTPKLPSLFPTVFRYIRPVLITYYLLYSTWTTSPPWHLASGSSFHLDVM